MNIATNVCVAMGAILNQNYRKVNGEWWLYNGDKPVKSLSDDEIVWHIERNHYPFCPDGVKSSSPDWWNEPTTKEVGK